MEDLINELKKAGLISPSAEFQDGLIWKTDDIFRNYEVIKKEAVLENLGQWKDDRINDLKRYEDFTEPFRRLSPYGSFEGYSASFLNRKIKEKKPEIQNAAEKKLKPWLHCPYGIPAVVHIFTTGEGTRSFCVIKRLDEVTKYWEGVIEELYEKVEAEPEEKLATKEIIRQALNKRLIVEKKKSNLELKFAKHEIKETRLQGGYFVNMFMALCEELNLTQFVFDDQRKENKKFLCEVSIQILDQGNPFWIETKNGLKDYYGKPLLLLESEGGGWFMKPKGGWAGVSNADHYYISTEFKVKITAKDS